MIFLANIATPMVGIGLILFVGCIIGITSFRPNLTVMSDSWVVQQKRIKTTVIAGCAGALIAVIGAGLQGINDQNVKTVVKEVVKRVEVVPTYDRYYNTCVDGLALSNVSNNSRAQLFSRCHRLASIQYAAVTKGPVIYRRFNLPQKTVTKTVVKYRKLPYGDFMAGCAPLHLNTLKGDLPVQLAAAELTECRSLAVNGMQDLVELEQAK